MSNSIELPRGYTDAFAQEQERIGNSLAFWRNLLNTTTEVIEELNRHVKQGKIAAESLSEHEFQIVYLGRALKLAMDHCEQRLFYYLLAASGRSEHDRDDQEPTEFGSLSLNREEDDDGVTLEGDTDLLIRSSSMTSSRRSVQQQLAEQLLGKLTMPKWSDDRFEDAP